MRAKHRRSLWREFVWPYYHIGDEGCVINSMKLLGQHVRKISFPDHVLPISKLVCALACCGNAVQLSLPTVSTLDIMNSEEILLSMRYLQSLDIQWASGIKELLELIVSCNINLKELTIREMYSKTEFLMIGKSDFTTVVEPWLHYWTTKWFSTYCFKYCCYKSSY